MKIKTKKIIQTEEEIELPITLIDEVVYLHYYTSGGYNSLFKVKIEGFNISYIYYNLSDNKIIKKCENGAHHRKCSIFVVVDFI